MFIVQNSSFFFMYLTTDRYIYANEEFTLSHETHITRSYLIRTVLIHLKKKEKKLLVSLDFRKSYNAKFKK